MSASRKTCLDRARRKVGPDSGPQSLTPISDKQAWTEAGGEVNLTPLTTVHGALSGTPGYFPCLGTPLAPDVSLYVVSKLLDATSTDIVAPGGTFLTFATIVARLVAAGGDRAAIARKLAIAIFAIERGAVANLRTAQVASDLAEVAELRAAITVTVMEKAGEEAENAGAEVGSRTLNRVSYNLRPVGARPDYRSGGGFAAVAAAAAGSGGPK